MRVSVGIEVVIVWEKSKEDSKGSDGDSFM